MDQADDLLAPFTVVALPDAGKDLRSLGSLIPDPKGMLLTPEQRSQRAIETIGMALGLVLIDHGWTLFAQPGDFCLKRADEEINPFTLSAEVLSGKITREAWIERCQALGISACRLSTAARADAS